MIRSLLVANRGEIARRIFRTASGMGIECVAVYVDADTDAPFVSEADRAIRLDSTYLDGPAIIQAAIAQGVDAIHPGYGFLSENAPFAAAVIDAGLTWVGPPPAVIEQMGDKLEAKALAESSGVNVLKSSVELDDADAIGYPILVKAAAGGGGKGMRVVASPDDLEQAVASAQREAESGFGDSRVFLERYVRRARHVEIQLLADNHQNVVHLGERECSIQRRHQKIIEESPSPSLSAEQRADMGHAALGLATAIGYQSAGTVEFLVDDDTGEFFFLEVNTRLQVEHPVTEEVTGIDLVREQLRIAGGEPLGYTQESITTTGHAIEARLYAEDAGRDFLPATGRLDAFTPAARPTARWDSGVEAGCVVGIDFDPMLAKVIVHAPTRTEAAARLALVLERCHLGGVVTNRDFLAAVLRSEPFLAGDTTTDFIARTKPTSGPTSEDLDLAAVVAAMWAQGRNRELDSMWGFAPANWRNGTLPEPAVSYTAQADTGADDPIEVTYRPRRDGSYQLGNGRVVSIEDWTPRGVSLRIDGVRAHYQVGSGADETLHVQVGSTTVSLREVPRFVVPGLEVPTGGLVAPMPGVVLEIRCEVGRYVEAGDVLAVLEAMKMEHHVSAPFDGVVTDINVVAGNQVENGALLLSIDDSSGDKGEPTDG